MEKDINNWLIKLAKKEKSEIPESIIRSPLFKNYFWKCFISVVNDPRMHNTLMDESFFKSVFHRLIKKVSLFDEINGQKLIEVLLNDKKYSNYKIANYLLKNTNNEIVSFYNKNSYPFTSSKNDYNNITVLPIKLLDDFLEHAIKKEIDSEKIKENKFYDITSATYLELINAYIDILDSEKYPSFYNQLKSMFYLIDRVSFDELTESIYKKTKYLVSQKQAPQLPFIIQEKNKNILVSDFEYILFNANKYFTKIVLNDKVKNIFFDVIHEILPNKDKNTLMPSTEKLMMQLHENLQKEVFYFEKFENKRFKYVENLRSADSILHIKTLMEKMSLLYKIVKTDNAPIEEDNKKVGVRRRI